MKTKRQRIIELLLIALLVKPKILTDKFIKIFD
jgi:hypothetical protein